MERWGTSLILLLVVAVALTADAFGQNRQVKIFDAGVAPGRNLRVPISIVAAGDEQAFGFSLNYDPETLGIPNVNLSVPQVWARGLYGAALHTNLSEAAQGRIGVTVTMPRNQTISAGEHIALQVAFNIPTAAKAGRAPLTVGDQPVARQVVDTLGRGLAATFTGGQIDITPPVTISVLPEQPTSSDDVVLEMRSTWKDTCYPFNPIVYQYVNLLTVITRRSKAACEQVISPFVMRVPLGKMARDDYSIVFIHQIDGLQYELGLVRLMVQGGLINSNASSYQTDSIAPDSIVAAFGKGLATTTTIAEGQSLPNALAGTSLRIRDSIGVEHQVRLFFVSPGQVNYHLPSAVAPGRAAVTLTNGNEQVSSGSVEITRVSPGIFTVDGSGRGLAAADIQRKNPQGLITYERVWSIETDGRVVARPVDFGSPMDELFLVLYGTGFRSRSSLSGIAASVGGQMAEVLSAGGVEGYVGLDQCVIRLHRQLIGRGRIEIELVVDGQPANKVTISVK